MPRYYPVPLEIREEDKPIGNVLSIRQLIYLGIGVGASLLLFFPIRGLALVFGAGPRTAAVLGLIPAPILLGVAAILAFAPAGALGLPGPKSPPSPDPFDPPMRFDQYLVLWWKFRKKQKRLPYRRDGYVPLPTPFDRARR